ncbi:MAG: Rv3235 family protein [Bifidobacteriaceae bacterium]|jgi:hypothetical protein|nr:Rv3235 family protein [Bifidobacteriaceae bacterium]
MMVNLDVASVRDDGASKKETTSESASTSPCNEKLKKVLSYYRSSETKKQIILSFASRNKVPVSSMLENGEYTGSKNNPFKFATTFIVTYFDVIRGIKSPNLLFNLSSSRVYNKLGDKYKETIILNKSFLPIPVSILSMHGYRINKPISEISAVVSDGGVIKIVVMRSVFTHNRWKVSYFEIIEANSRSVRII